MKLVQDTHKFIGHWTRQNFWYPNPDAVVPGSFKVCRPSYQWKHLYIRHIYTQKYCRLLLEHNPDLWAKFVDPETVDFEKIKSLPYGKKGIAKLVAMKIERGHTGGEIMKKLQKTFKDNHNRLTKAKETQRS